MNQFSSKIILFVTLIALASCSTVKTIKLMKSGEVAQEDFFQEIPFEYRLGLVIIEVTIAGDDYNFLVDTGAPNLVSKELAEKLGLANVSEQKVGDSQGKKASLGFVQIDEVRIGNLSFRQTGAAVADLNQSQEIGCMEIDGFIGANLMRKAIWKIDYEHQIITITNKAEQLKIPDNALRIPFYTVMTGSPIVDVSLNKQVKANGTILDMGSSGDITLPRKNLDKLNKQMANIPQIKSFGSASAGLYGSADIDTSYIAVMNSVSFGDVELDSTLVEFRNVDLPIIGTGVLKNYDVVFDWFEKEALFIKQKDYDHDSLSAFGFLPGFDDDKFIVGTLLVPSNAAEAGVRVGDQILRINDLDFKAFGIDDWCEAIQGGRDALKKVSEKDKVLLQVLRNGKVLEFEIAKSKLL